MHLGSVAPLFELALEDVLGLCGPAGELLRVRHDAFWERPSRVVIWISHGLAGGQVCREQYAFSTH